MMDLKNVMSVQEASYRWDVSVDTINSRIRTIAKNKSKLEGMVDANLIKQSHKTWILTTDLMKIWFGSEEKMQMKKLVELWETELVDEVSDIETLESYHYDINNQQSQYRWYGVDGIILSEATLNDGRKFYIVDEETVTEVIKVKESPYAIRESLLECYESGDQNTVAIFENQEDAYNFLKKEYYYDECMKLGNARLSARLDELLKEEEIE